MAHYVESRKGNLPPLRRKLHFRDTSWNRRDANKSSSRTNGCAARDHRGDCYEMHGRFWAKNGQSDLIVAFSNLQNNLRRTTCDYGKEMFHY